MSDAFPSSTISCLAYDETKEGVDGWDWDSQILRAILAQDWQIAGGAANVFYLYREASADCWNRLYMIGELFGEPDDIAYSMGGPGAYDPDLVDGLFVFVLEPEPACGDDRYIHN
ncbi:hypothetical protein [Maricaulis maris]|uniref:hypothetical protein n=1 Tax=Maricaulis maris TaxID=74318 RepID=UPI003A95B40F